MSDEVIHLAGEHRLEDGGAVQRCAVCGTVLDAEGGLFTPGSAVKELGGPGSLNFAQIVTPVEPTCDPDGLGGALVKLTYTEDGERAIRSPVPTLVLVVALVLFTLALIFLE